MILAPFAVIVWLVTFYSLRAYHDAVTLSGEGYR
jgi:hypothetical protein